MNCKPNDLARIVHPSEYGRLVTVMYAAPTEPYVLPDGAKAMPARPGAWVCQMLGGAVRAPVYENGSLDHYRLARYVAINDRWLRPIRDKDGVDETLTWAGKPAPVETMAPKPQREFAR